MIIISVGQRIKLARREAGLTQEKLGQMTNLSRSYIAAIEIDAYNPSLMTLQRIAEVLRVSVSSLIEEQESEGLSNFLGGGVLTNDFKLNEEQIILLIGFSKLDLKNRQRLLGYIDALLEMTEAKK